jgi:hypothetical protein
MLFGETFRIGTKTRWIAGTAIVALLGAGLFLAGLTKGAGIPRTPRRGIKPGAPARTRPVVAEDESRVAASFANLPLSFEPNQGQTDSQVKFLSRNPRYNVFLTSNEAVFALPVRSSEETRPQGRVAKIRQSRLNTQAVLRMKILGANPAPAVAGETSL